MVVAEARRTPEPGRNDAVLRKLSTLDRFLPLWIAIAMAVGLGLGSLVPSLNDGLGRSRARF
jgi:ACR3 family arsenite transporter